MARVEQQRQLADLVLALREPYRQVVLLRFYDGLTQKRIAARLDVPVATVNSRLTRAVAMLRAELDRRHGGDRSAWIVALIPLAEASSISGLGLGAATLGALSVMSKSLWILAAVAVLLASLLFGTFRPDALRTTTSDLVTVAAEPDAPHPRVGSAQPVDPSGADHPTRAEPDAPPTPSDEPSPPLGADVDGVPRVVRVVFEEDRTPVAGAEVFVLSAHRVLNDPELRERRRVGYRVAPLTIDDLAERFSERFITDEAGEVAFSLDGDADVYIRFGDLFGHGHVGEYDGGELVVAVTERRWVDVRVEESGGAAASGIPVDLWIHASGEPLHPLFFAVTDREGRARFLLNPYDDQLAGAESELCARLSLPAAREDRRLARHVSRQEVTFVLPDTGSLQVSVTDAEGTRIDETAYVTIADPTTPAWVSGPPIATEPTVDGVARFPRVGLGEELRVRASVDGMRGSTAVVAGPTRSGETIEVTLVMRGRPLVVRGAMVDADDEPWSDADLSITGVEQSVTHGSTDPTGRFELTIPYTDEDSLQLALDAPGGQLTTSIEVPPDVGEDLELGRIALAPKGEAIRGVVIDPSGRPKAGVWVTLVRPGDDSAGGTDWVPAGNSGITDAEGRFEFRVDVTGARWIMAMAYGQWQTEPVALRIGDDLRIVAPSLGSLDGRIVVDAAIPLETIVVMARPDGDGDVPDVHTPGWQTTGVSADGTFRVDDLTAGRYVLVVAASHLDGVLCEVRGLHVAASDDRTDPRIQPLDLRGRLQWIRVDVTDEHDEAVTADLYALDVQGKLRQLGTSDRYHLFASDYELATVLVVHKDDPVISTGPFHGVRAVTLRPGIDVTVEWRADATAPPLRVIARLVPDAPIDVPGGLRAAAAIDRFGPREATLADDRFDLVVERRGSYRLAVIVERERDGVVDSRELTDPARRPIIDVSAPTTWSFRPPAAVVERAVAELLRD